MRVGHYRILFVLFLISGFCGLLYQVVWVRMAYASFGVITPVLSVVISVFMLGLSIGSWAGGKWINRLTTTKTRTPLLLYAGTEAFLGLGAFAVPALFAMWNHVLLGYGEMNTYRYLFHSAVMISISILPWCIFMGFTFPFMMAFIKKSGTKSESSFSYLYFANVIGAMLGTLTTAIALIEMLGFQKTLFIAAALNFSIAIVSILLAGNHRYSVQNESAGVAAGGEGKQNLPSTDRNRICSILFMTGFVSLSMEVVWIRAFTPILKTATYSFAALLAVYLFGTWIGSFLYRKHIAGNKVAGEDKLMSSIAVFALLPLVMNDPRMQPGVLGVLASIFPFCAALGYLTPQLIDRYSAGDPYKGGRAYALNIIGCIIGPLFASYVLLPLWGVKTAFLLLSAPFLAFLVLYYRKTLFRQEWTMVMGGLALFIFLRTLAVHVSYEENYAAQKGVEVRRDHTATVVSYGYGIAKQLLVNGVGITKLTDITKAMAHLPLAYCSEKPESALVICFGMGTTFRSLMSWDIRTVAVELVPSVKEAFGFYFQDAANLLKNPKGDIVIDDGRRYLARTSETFDVITIDPPPPIETAGSSLLYSDEFYDLVKKRLNKGGILQQWIPVCELETFQAAARSILNSFPHVKVLPSAEGWGAHFMASSQPIPELTAEELIARMPPAALADFTEWYQDKNLLNILAPMVNADVKLERILAADPEIRITDDRPYNEYYLLRRIRDLYQGSYRVFTRLPCGP